jgi:hypothetical protein
MAPELKKLRDSLADKMLEEFKSLDFAEQMEWRSCYKEGFEACHTHFEPKIRELIETLKWFRASNDKVYSAKAADALLKYHEWAGEEQEPYDDGTWVPT